MTFLSFYAPIVHPRNWLQYVIQGEDEYAFTVHETLAKTEDRYVFGGVLNQQGISTHAVLKVTGVVQKQQRSRIPEITHKMKLLPTSKAAVLALQEVAMLKRFKADKVKNAVSLLAFFKCGPVYCVALERLEKDLYEILTEKEAFSFEDTLLVATQLLEFLAYLKKKNIVHRDLKLENIFLSQDKKLKVIDFEGSKQLDNARLTPARTTPEIMAPEYLLNLPAKCDFDMWSLGVNVFSLYTGCGFYNYKDGMRPTSVGQLKLDVMCCMIEILGLPPPEIAAKAPDLFLVNAKGVAFKGKPSPGLIVRSWDDLVLSVAKAARKKRDSKERAHGIVDIIEGCLRWRERLTPEQQLTLLKKLYAL